MACCSFAQTGSDEHFRSRLQPHAQESRMTDWSIASDILMLHLLFHHAQNASITETNYLKHTLLSQCHFCCEGETHPLPSLMLIFHWNSYHVSKKKIVYKCETSAAVLNLLPGGFMDGGSVTNFSRQVKPLLNQNHFLWQTSAIELRCIDPP